MHLQKDHHVAMEASMFAPGAPASCICGSTENDAIHSAPPCEWCADGAGEFGSPAPWWHKAWCRFVARWLQ